MAARLRSFGRRLADLGTGLADAFVRDNRVLPPVLAVLVLFVIAWILAGALVGGGPAQKPVAHKADLAQSGNAPGTDNVAPGVENRDVDSYAAYRSKDPFREIFAPEKTAQEQTTTRPARRRASREHTTGAGRARGGPSAGGRGAASDTDNDGVPDRRERTLGSDPNNPDTDGDGIPDGSDPDANGDGLPDTGGAGPGSRPGGGRAGGGAPGGGAAGGRNGDLLNSGGILPIP